MAKIKLFAENLITPSHMEWLPDGRLLMSEHKSGRVIDITNGGDFSNATPFAYGLEGPASILPLIDGKLLVANSWAGNVMDITNGGDMKGSAPFAYGLTLPYSLINISKPDGNKILVSGGQQFLSEITDITNGGGSEKHKKYYYDIPTKSGFPGLAPAGSWPDWEKSSVGACIANWGGGGHSSKKGFLISNQHYNAISAMGQIVDITDFEGTYIDSIKQNKLIAWGLPRIGAIKFNEGDNQLYITLPERGEIMRIDINSPKNYHFVPPIIKGIEFPTCIRFSPDGTTMLACSMSHGVVYEITDFN